MEFVPIKKLSARDHPDVGVIPAGFVFEIVTLLNETGEPDNVIAPEPPKFTSPALEKLLPIFTVTADVGVKLMVPLLVIVPLLVSDPRIFCVVVPQLNDAPAPIVRACRIVQSTLG